MYYNNEFKIQLLYQTMNPQNQNSDFPKLIKKLSRQNWAKKK